LVQRANFFGIDDPAFRGGGRIAVGDVNGDQFADVIVGAGFGGGPRITIFQGKGLTNFGSAGSPPNVVGDFFVFEPGLFNGTWVAAGHVNGDNFADLTFGGGPGGGSRVFTMSGATLLTAGAVAANAQPLANFFAFNANERGGVRVSVKDLDGDARLDLAVGSGEGATAAVRTYLGRTLSGSSTPSVQQEFDPFGSTLANGVFVG
jgi:hypothetical protein